MANKNLRPMLRKAPETAFDAILAQYKSPDTIVLTDEQEKIKKRWSFVLQCRLEIFTRQEIANRLVDQFGISMALAYQDIRNSDIMYGDVLKADKEGTKAILYEYALELYRKAKQQQDLKAQSKALELLAKFGGVEAEDKADFDPDKFKNIPVEITLPPELLKILQDSIKGGVVDLNKLNVVDIPYTDVTDDSDK